MQLALCTDWPRGGSHSQTVYFCAIVAFGCAQPADCLDGGLRISDPVVVAVAGALEIESVRLKYIIWVDDKVLGLNDIPGSHVKW